MLAGGRVWTGYRSSPTTAAAQLGHSEVTATARHYGRRIGGDAYLEALPLRPGEVPADLLAQIAPEKSPPSPPKGAPSGASSGAEIERFRRVEKG